MKQFNLEKALAGDPVITRNGKKVEEIKLFKTKINNNKVLFGVIDGWVLSFNIDGRNNSILRFDTEYDLFMAPVKHIGWVNRYDICKTKTKALKCSQEHELVKVEWEE